LNYDKSGGFITIPDNHIIFTKREKAELLEDEQEV
jgi:hypothetical protein